MSNRIIRMLYEDAARLADELAKEIRAETNIDSLRSYAEARHKIIWETLDAIAILRKAGL